MNEQPVLLITGASSGIGKACFDYLFSKGYKVYGTSRKPGDQNPYLLKMDVNNKKSIDAAIRHLINKEGKIDVLINNAGISVVGAAELTSEENARLQMETNFWGAVQVTHAVLPHMRKKQAGKIINVSSLAGLFAIPFQGFYTASKHALEGYSEALRMELKAMNIHVSLIEPGDFKTEISQNRILSNEREDKDYKKGLAAAMEIIVKGERKGDKASKVAKLCQKIIQSKRPKLRYRIGKPLDLSAAVLKKFLPQRLFEWLIMDHYQLNKAKKI